MESWYWIIPCLTLRIAAFCSGNILTFMKWFKLEKRHSWGWWWPVWDWEERGWRWGMSVLCSQLTFPAAVTQSKRINLPNCFLWPELSRTDNTRRQPSEEQRLDWSLFTAQRRNVETQLQLAVLLCFEILELSLLSECIIEEYYLQVKFINTNHKYFVDYLYLEEL